MITKKTKKTNTKATTNQGYDLKNIKTKKASQPKKKNGALHGFFSLIGFIIGIGSLMALIVPMAIHANQGVYIVEPFSCEVEILNEEAVNDRMEYINRVDTNLSMFHEYKELFKVHDLIIKSLIINECEVK